MHMIDKRSILMIYDQLYIGGIETLIVRTSKWLIDHGYDVKLILRDKGTLFESLDNDVQVRVYGNWFELLFTPFLANIIFRGSFFQGEHIVYTFRPEGLWIASVLAKVKKKEIKVLNCVYHPFEFFMKGQEHYQTKFYSQLLQSKFPSKNLAFMNLPCKRSHEQFFKKAFDNAFIFPLPVTGHSVQAMKRNPVKYKLVSIGNFKSFKSYNTYMVDVVDQLIQDGFPIQYDIYGEGEMRAEIEDRIKKKNLSQYIHLKGQVDYKNFRDVLTDSFLFIGMGTAAVEAALCKLPTIVATCDLATSYGYMYNMPGFAVGEQIDGLKEFQVEYLIRRVFSLSKKEYDDEALLNYNHALRFDMDTLMTTLVNKFETENEIEACSFSDLPLGLYIKYYFKRIGYKITHVTSKFVEKLRLPLFQRTKYPLVNYLR